MIRIAEFPAGTIKEYRAYFSFLENNNIDYRLEDINKDKTEHLFVNDQDKGFAHYELMKHIKELGLQKEKIAFFRPSLPKLSNTKATLSVLIACLFVFVLQGLGGVGFIDSMKYHGEFGLTWIAEPWRAITPVLMHGGLFHLIMNMFAWVYIGKLIEHKMSGKLLLSLTVIFALVSSFFQFVISGGNFVGLSGAIMGLISFVWAAGKTNPHATVGLPNSTMIVTVAWVAMGYVVDFNFANEAHLFGLLAGIIAAFVLKDVPIYSNVKQES